MQTNHLKTQMLFIFFALLCNLCSAQQKSNTQLTSEFDKMLSAQFRSGETGATVLVSRKGQIIYKKAFGMSNLELDVPMQVNNVFRIGSITKQFTAIAILQLMEQGKLNVQDEITRFIPDYPTQGSKITIEHLLTHTSGIRDFASIRDTVQRGRLDVTTQQMIDHFKNQPMRFAPGTRWEYSNSGYFLLGYIIEKITGKTYAEYLDDNFFKPLGMNSSRYATDTKIVKNRAYGYSKGDKGLENAAYHSMSHPYAAGAIQSTVEDLLKWQLAVQSFKLVKKETLDKAFTRYKLTNGIETAYGYGWRMGYIQESPSLWHGGLINGFISMAMYLPKEDIFVAVLSNCDCNSPVDITAKLAALAIGKPYSYEPINLDNNILQEYAGVYENGKGQQRVITVSKDGAYAQLNRSPKASIKAYQKDKFFFTDDAMVSIAFGRDASGKVEKLTTLSRTAIEVWSKTDKPIPAEDGIKLDEKILEQYVGVYEVAPEFTFTITRKQDRLFLRATGQEEIEIFAESENKFFLKVNDAQVEFVKDGTGNVTKAVLNQGGRRTEAKRIRNGN